MAIAVLLAGAPERDAVEHRHIVLDYRGLTDDESARMIEKDAAADLRRGVDIAPEYGRYAALEITGKVLAASASRPVS